MHSFLRFTRLNLSVFFLCIGVTCIPHKLVAQEIDWVYSLGTKDSTSESGLFIRDNGMAVDPKYGVVFGVYHNDTLFHNGQGFDAFLGGQETIIRLQVNGKPDTSMTFSSDLGNPLSNEFSKLLFRYDGGIMLQRPYRNNISYNGLLNPFGMNNTSEQFGFVTINKSTDTVDNLRLKNFAWENYVSDTEYRVYGIGFLKNIPPNIVQDSIISFNGLPDREHLLIGRMDTAGELKSFSTLGLFKGFTDPKKFDERLAVSSQGDLGVAILFQDTVYLTDTTLYPLQTFQQNGEGSQEGVIIQYDTLG
ncbi:MAG: hypothetical protein AAFN93_19300, partial [Bacteroidota bacterium]